jgi:hypothetical protein
MNRFTLPAGVLMCALTASLAAQDKIYVSPEGKDAASGTKAKPVATFARAQQLARKVPAGKAVEVLFSPGTYYLDETITFTAADNKYPVTYRSEAEGKAVISGGRQLKLSWKPYRDGIWQAAAPAGMNIDQLYVDGIRQPMARFPNVMPGATIMDSWGITVEREPGKLFIIPDLPADSTMDPFQPSRISGWKDPSGGYLHAMHAYLWGDQHYRITGKNPDGTLAYEGGWQNNRPAPMHGLYRYAENIFEELDAPGEWFHDGKTGILYYKPVNGADPGLSCVEVVRLRRLVGFEGTKDNPVKGITLDGFVFRHAARTFMDTREQLLRSDWAICREGAVFFSGAEDCRITNCEFDQVGGNSVFVSNWNTGIVIRGCWIHDGGASGIAFVGDPAMVRNPIFRYGDQDYSKISKVRGPLGDNYPDMCRVEDCLIEHTGRVEKQTAGVHISMSHGIWVSSCSIYDMPRAGININEGTFGGHVIENCDVFNTVLETGDHGSFNSWGRDRYWTPDIKATADQVAMDSTLPYLDMLDPNIIQNSRWRCDHGWDIDLDDGSSWYLIHNNLLLKGGLKMREGYYRQAYNNVIINNSLHPHVWYYNSGDLFRSNIVFHSYYEIWMNASMPKDGKWGRELDRNFFAAPKAEMTKFNANGCDLNSFYGDPQFMDPAKGDFRTREGSPAHRAGITGFFKETYGVMKPSLRAIAKTPEIPEVILSLDPPEGTPASPVPPFSWLGCTATEPKGEALSAFGVGFAEGGVALTEVPEGSAGHSAGFRAGDLVQEINGVRIRSLANLKAYLAEPKGDTEKQEAAVIRKQNRMVVVFRLQ